MGAGDPIPAVVEMSREEDPVYCYIQLANALGLRYWHVGHDKFCYVKDPFEANIPGVMQALREAGALQPHH